MKSIFYYMKNEIIFCILLGLLGVILSGCEGQKSTEYQNTKGLPATWQHVTSILDCDIYYIRISSYVHDVYLTKCSDGTSATEHMSGKSHVYNVQQNGTKVIGPVNIPEVNNQPNKDIGKAAVDLDKEFRENSSEEQKILDLAEKIQMKRAALQKLTPEERSSLGFDEE